MKVKDLDTERLIKDTAKRVFFVEGRTHATTQDIADAAGVSRTLLHYYFRSRDILFNQVFKETMAEVKSEIDKILTAKMLFKSKIEKLVTFFLSRLEVMPYREIFLINEINSSNFEMNDHGKEEQVKFKEFIKDIQKEMDKGAIKPMNPAHFILNLFSLLAHPFVMGPLNRRLFNMSDKQYRKLLKERKQIILQTLFI
jgi:TetR/AcrR family transcriptional regulator